MFVDYAGQTVPVINRITGEIKDAEIFVTVLGASNYTYAEATSDQTLPNWIGSHIRTFEYFGGVSEIIVPDNLKYLLMWSSTLIDDWGLSILTDQNRNDFLEILEDRHNMHSTIICGQLPVEHWHEVIGNATIADAILDRLVHNAYKIDMKGGSMRKIKSKLT